jgi:2-dehydro-3-deoxygluconokinase
MAGALMGRIVCFGEMLIRLSAPGRELLLRNGWFDVCIGGAEANVAVGLACLDHQTAMVSGVPDNPLGEAAIQHLRRYGVSVDGVVRGAGRMGLYFVSQGAGVRPSAITYDREGSSFALAEPSDFDWDSLLDTAELLHLSGVTAALGPKSAQIAIAAAEAARSKGVRVSFDANYRAQLWQRWEGNPRSILSDLVSRSDILFGNHRDISLLLGCEFPDDGPERRRGAAAAAFEAFPNLQLIASTARHVDTSGAQSLAARLDARDKAHQTDEIVLAEIVDRIGGGDAFAAGVLHGVLRDKKLEESAEYGLALACLKHTLPGDASLFTQDDIDAFLAGERDVRR